MRRSALLTVVLVAVAGLVPLAGEAACHPVCSTPTALMKDRSIVLAQASFLPSSIEVPLGGRLIFQNADQVRHTFTLESPACRATTETQTCDAFDKAIRVGDVLGSAKYLQTGSMPGQLGAGTYGFYCKYHSASPGTGMVGTLTIL